MSGFARVCALARFFITIDMCVCMSMGHVIDTNRCNNNIISCGYLSVFRQGDVGTNWYAVLSGSLDMNVSETGDSKVSHFISLHCSVYILKSSTFNVCLNFHHHQFILSVNQVYEQVCNM